MFRRGYCSVLSNKLCAKGESNEFHHIVKTMDKDVLDFAVIHSLFHQHKVELSKQGKKL